MNKRTKALSIPPAVKVEVWKRDGQRCIICGSPHAFPDAHYISRGQGGLGVPKNVVTLCRSCHRSYDQSIDRPMLRVLIREYLRAIYPDWDESLLIYRKGLFNDTD